MGSHLHSDEANLPPHLNLHARLVGDSLNVSVNDEVKEMDLHIFPGWLLEDSARI
jgi:hypothetical protein